MDNNTKRERKQDRKPRAKTQRELRLGVVKAYLVTFVDNAGERQRDMVWFATSGVDAENQTIRKHNLPANLRERRIVSTVQAKGGPATTTVTPFESQLQTL